MAKIMTRAEMIRFIVSNPNVHITHTLFDPSEYIYLGNDGNIYDENGYLFENWDSPFDKWSGWNGIRMRDGAEWQTGWRVKE